MEFKHNKKLKIGTMVAMTFFLIMVCGCESQASMNLETDAAVSGISVALNNYYARTQDPEEALAESVKMVASDTIVVDEDNTKKRTTNAVQKLVQDVTPTEEKIVKEGEGGLTWGTVKDTASLRLRDKPNADAKTLTLLANGEHYIVTGQEGQFLKIQVDDDLEGYVFKDYIDTSISYDDELKKEKESLAAQAEQAKKEAAEAMRMLEEAKKSLQSAVETKADETKATVKATEKSAEAAETEKATEKATEAATEKVEAKTEAKTEAKSETKADSKNTAETVEELNWDDDSGDDTDDADDGNSDTDNDSNSDSDNDSDNVEVIEAPDFDEEMSAAEDETEEELQEVDEPAETISSSASTGPGGVADATRNAIVAYAKQFLGNPYVFGGTSLTNGCDCSGFTQAIYSYFGKSIGRSSRDQAAKGTTINPADAQPGDLFFYDSNGTINHVAMYIGGGQVIHSSSTATGIKISNAYYRTPCKVCRYF